MSRVVLVGLPGVGKTSVAQSLAQRWGCTWVDTDDLISTKVGIPVAEYLRHVGEAVFRVEELSALRTALAQYDVVATGGGAVATADARELLAENPTVWLDCDDQHILVRLDGGDRPLLNGDPATSLARLRTTRTPWYLEVSRARIDTSGTLEEVGERVQEALAEVE